MDAGIARRSTFSTRDGLTLVADAYGEPDAPPVLLVHGGGQTRHSWGGTAEVLASRGWLAMPYDQRGHGESDRATDAAYHLMDFAADLEDVIRSCDRPPVVVGASLGGLAAMIVEGSTAPGIMAAVVLVDITPRQEQVGVDRVVTFMLDRAKDGFASLEDVAEAVASYQPQRSRPPSTEGLKKNLRHDPDGRWRWHWDPELFNPERGLRSARKPGLLMDAAQNIAAPTLLVRGKLSDLVSPETVTEFLEAVPHAQFVDVSGAGHMVAGDKNDRFTQAVVDFIEELPAEAG